MPFYKKIIQYCIISILVASNAYSQCSDKETQAYQASVIETFEKVEPTLMGKYKGDWFALIADENKLKPKLKLRGKTTKSSRLMISSYQSLVKKTH